MPIDRSTPGGPNDDARHPARRLRRLLSGISAEPVGVRGDEAVLPEEAFEPAPGTWTWNGSWTLQGATPSPFA